MGSSARTPVPSKVSKEEAGEFSPGGSEFGVFGVPEAVPEGMGPEGGIPGELGLGSVELARCILARGGGSPSLKETEKAGWPSSAAGC